MASSLWKVGRRVVAFSYFFLASKQYSSITSSRISCFRTYQVFYAERFVSHSCTKFNMPALKTRNLHCGNSRESKIFRTNQGITAKNIRLIDQAGKNLGVMSLRNALAIGMKEKCSVLQVAITGTETVCKLASKQELYEKMKEQKKKRAKTTKMKEIKLTGKISDHDLETKLRKIREFLEDHNSVKVFVAHRKRQNTSMDDKHAVVENIANQIRDIGVLQGDPKPAGNGLRSLFIPHPHK